MNLITPRVEESRSHTVRRSLMAAFREHWPWFAFIGCVLVLMYFLGPILSPFVIGATFAYMGNPLVDKLEHRKLSRSLSTSLIFLVVTTVIVVGIVLLVPLLQEQVLSLIENIPVWLHWIQDVGLPKLHINLPPGIKLDADGLRNVVAQHWAGASDFATIVVQQVGSSTPALLGFIADLLLIPIVTFYLLRDWEVMVGRIHEIIPVRLQPGATRFAKETDGVLSALIRGQLLVMVALAIYYSATLYVFGLKVALLVGLFTGLVSFIPYLGFASGIVVATIAMAVQKQSGLAVLEVIGIYGFGQVIESGFLTPMLVGDRIGLHPVAVIFAILAGGQLFGFIGVLVALPVAAVLAVLIRHAMERWLKSSLYLGTSPSALIMADAEPPPAS